MEQDQIQNEPVKRQAPALQRGDGGRFKPKGEKPLSRQFKFDCTDEEFAELSAAIEKRRKKKAGTDKRTLVLDMLQFCRRPDPFTKFF